MPEDYTPKLFDGLDPSQDGHFEKPDEKKIVPVFEILDAAHKYRQPAIDQAKKCVALMYNKFTEVMEETTPRTSDLGQSVMPQGSRRQYYPVNLLLGQTQIRQSNYSSVPTDFVATRLTLCESDRIAAEVATGMANRFASPQIENRKGALTLKMSWEGHTLFFVSWDPTLGPKRQRPVLTDEAKSEYFDRDEKGRRTVRVVKPNVLLEGQTVKRKRKLAGVIPAGEEDVQAYQKSDRWGQLMFDEIPTGLPRIDVVGPMEYLIDPLATEGVADARWIARERRVDASYLYAEFGDRRKFPDAWKKLDKFKAWSKKLVLDSGEEYVRAKMKMETRSDMTTSAVLTEFYMKPAPQHGLPRGLYAVIVSENGSGSGGQGKSSVLAWEELPWPHELPVVGGAVEIPTPVSFYGETYVRYLAPLNHQFNQIYGYINEAAGLASQRVLANSQSSQSQFKAETVLGLPGVMALQLPDGTAPGTPVNELRYDGTAVLQMTVLKEIVEAMEAVSNTHGMGSMKQADLAVEVIGNLQRDETVAGLVKSRLGRMFSDTAHLFLRLCQRYLSIEDLQLLMPDYAKRDLVQFKTSDMSANSTKLRLRHMTVFSNNPAMQLEYFKYFSQLGERIFQIFKPEQIAEVVLSEKTFTELPWAKERELAERENSLLADTERTVEDAVRMVAPHDDDDVHIGQHRNPVTDVRRDLLPAPYLTKIDAHIFRHEEQKAEKLRKKTAEALAAQAAAQAQIQPQAQTAQAVGAVVGAAAPQGA